MANCSLKKRTQLLQINPIFKPKMCFAKQPHSGLGTIMKNEPIFATLPPNKTGHCPAKRTQFCSLTNNSYPKSVQSVKFYPELAEGLWFLLSNNSELSRVLSGKKNG